MSSNDYLSPDIEAWPDFVPGWENRPDEVAAVAALQPIGAFEDTPAGLSEKPLPERVNQDNAAIKVTGKPLPGENQGNAGTCVAFGTARAINYALLCAIAAGLKMLWKPIAIEPIYGGSRIEVGGGRLGRQDGSIQAWASEFCKNWGVAPRELFGKYKIDLRSYSINLARDWGTPGHGVPNVFEPELRMHPVKSIAKITTTDGLARALAAGKGVAAASGYLLNRRRGPNGIVSIYRGGGHDMAVKGYMTIGGTRYFKWDNSWGPEAHTGPTNDFFPDVLGGLVAERDAQKILDEGDTWAHDSVEGFADADYADWLV